MNSPLRVVVTAGHCRSVPSELLAELLRRDGVEIAGVLVVSLANPGRLRELLRQRGLPALLSRVRQGMMGAGSTQARSPLAEASRRQGFHAKGLRSWCRTNRVPLATVKSLNSPSAIGFVRDAAADLVVYTGGGIIRTPFLEAAGRVINAHAGPLPEIRGMNAAEWSALLGARPETTVHFIDRGIDTGTVIRCFAYARHECKSIDELREQAVVAGIAGVRSVIAEREFDAVRPERPTAKPHRQCYIMAPVLAEQLDSQLSSGNHPHDQGGSI